MASIEERLTQIEEQLSRSEARLADVEQAVSVKGELKKEVIEAGRMTLIDAGGRRQIDLDTSEDGGMLSLFHPAGEMQAQLGSSEQGAKLFLLDRDDTIWSAPDES